MVTISWKPLIRLDQSNTTSVIWLYLIRSQLKNAFEELKWDATVPDKNKKKKTRPWRMGIWLASNPVLFEERVRGRRRLRIMSDNESGATFNCGVCHWQLLESSTIHRMSHNAAQLTSLMCAEVCVGLREPGNVCTWFQSTDQLISAGSGSARLRYFHKLKKMQVYLVYPSRCLQTAVGI